MLRAWLGAPSCRGPSLRCAALEAHGRRALHHVLLQGRSLLIRYSTVATRPVDPGRSDPPSRPRHASAEAGGCPRTTTASVREDITPYTECRFLTVTLHDNVEDYELRGQICAVPRTVVPNAADRIGGGETARGARHVG